jgi:glycerophosphoryl diester phosphodiesterase
MVAAEGPGVSVVEVLRRNLSRFSAMAELALRQLGVLVLASIPFGAGAAVVYHVYLGEHDINYYLHLQPREWVVAVRWIILIALGYGACVAVLALRWLFALPLLLVGQVSPRDSLGRSWRLTRGRLGAALTTVGGWWLFVGILGSVGAAVLRGISGWVLDGLGERVPLVLLAVMTTLLVGTGLALSLAFLGKGVGVILVRVLLHAVDPSGAAPASVVGQVRRHTPDRRIPRPFWVGLGLVFAGMMAMGSLWVQGIDLSEDVKITAHRGSSKLAPENTLSAIRQALEDEADMAEIDVQTTRDRVVVLLHDRDFMRLAGDPRRLEDLTLARAREVDVGRAFNERFSGESIPTLEEVIREVRGRLSLNIELKYNRSDPALAPAVIELIRGEGILGECVITSLELAALEMVKELEPEAVTGLIVTQSVGDPTRLPVDFLSLNTARATGRLISHAHRQGKAVHVWTVNDRATMERMIERGVDNVITDYPADMRAVLRERTALTPAEKLALRLRRLLTD